MKRFSLHMLTLLAFCGAMAMTGIANAQAADNDRGDRREQREARRDKPRGDGPASEARRNMAKVLFKDVELSEEQRKEVRDVMQKHRAGVEKWREENKQEIRKLRERIQEARRDKDRDAARAAFEELLKLGEDRPKPDALLDDIRGELTAEQVQQFNENVEAIKEKAKDRMEERRKKAKERREQRQNQRDRDRD
ncbi:MAG: hypothetical protein ACOC1G_06650 [Phycisphaeraceae bacterium]